MFRIQTSKNKRNKLNTGAEWNEEKVQEMLVIIIVTASSPSLLISVIVHLLFCTEHYKLFLCVQIRQFNACTGLTIFLPLVFLSPFFLQDHNSTLPSKVTQAVILLKYIQEMSGSNLCWHTVLNFFCFPVPSGRYWDSTSN